MEIQTGMKMTDMIHLNYNLINVLTRFEISIGFGDKTVEEICAENSIDIDFFLQIVNAFHDENYFPRLQFLNFPISKFIQYLRRAHADYLYHSIPKIEDLLNELMQSYEGETKYLSILKEFFDEYKNELEFHINREENRVFPYALDLEKAYENLEIDEQLHERIQQYSIEDYLNEHNDVEEKLYDLKNLLLKYFPKGGDVHLQEDLIHQIFLLEKDLHKHSIMEDKVLVPKVSIVERELEMLYHSNRRKGEEDTKKNQNALLHQKQKDSHLQSDLSKREKEIIREIALGFTSKEIAERLFISLHTVLTHRKNINRKLGIKTVSGITVFAILNGLVTSEEVA